MPPRSDTALAAVAACACALVRTPGASAAIISYDMFYSVAYHQQSDAFPTVPSECTFAARVTPSNPADLDSALLEPPVCGVVFNLPGSNTAFAGFDFDLSFLELDALYPAGDYTYFISGGLLGNQTGVISRGPFFFTSDIPAFVGGTCSSLQNCNPAAANELRFASFTPGLGAGVGLTLFVLFDDEDGSVVQSNQFASTQTAAVIAPNLMQPAHRYRATLYYSSRVERPNQGLGGAASIVGNDRITDFIFTTRASCPADFNHDGVVDPDDLSDFIGCFFTPPCGAADFNNDAFVNPDDLSDYIGAFFDGC